MADRLDEVRRPQADLLAPNDRLAHVRSIDPQPAVALPTVEELLDVDREYRERAAAGTLRRIAPWRMNPTREAWLPILHTTRGTRRYTALYSNTPRAHEQHTTHDWVVLYFDHDGGRGERQCTIITARYGALAGHRVVRGREHECLGLVRRREWEAVVEASRTRRLAGNTKRMPPVLRAPATEARTTRGAVG